MSQTDRTQPFATLAETLAGAPTEAGIPAWDSEPWGDPILDELVRSFLIWEAGPKHAASAYKRIRDACVDENELRICLTDEIADLLGARFPKAEIHAERLRLALNDVYSREHGMTLASLTELSKRECKAYFESMISVPGFVRARVLLLALGAHAFPVDSRISSALRDLGFEHDHNDHDAAASQIERAVRASEARAVYLALEHRAATKKGSRSRASASGVASD